MKKSQNKKTAAPKGGVKHRPVICHYVSGAVVIAAIISLTWIVGAAAMSNRPAHTTIGMCDQFQIFDLQASQMTLTYCRKNADTASAKPRKHLAYDGSAD